MNSQAEQAKDTGTDFETGECEGTYSLKKCNQLQPRSPVQNESWEVVGNGAREGALNEHQDVFQERGSLIVNRIAYALKHSVYA